MSESEKRVPVKVPGTQGGTAPSSSTGHIEDLDHKLKDLSRRLVEAPARFASGRLSPSRTSDGLPDTWRQHADLYDLCEEFRILVEVPGIPKNELYIAVTDRDIRIERERSAVGEEESESPNQREPYSKILRRVQFPGEVMADRAEATLNNGVLEVRIPKKTPTAQPKHRILVR